MNYLAARQRTADGRWDYTWNGAPCGYCREYRPLSEEEGQIIPAEMAKRENEKMRPLAGNFHSDGHATKEEACECYKRYMLDTALRLCPEEPENANQQFRCEICRKFTACYAQVGPYRLFNLCPEHQTREQVAKLFEVGESWES